MSGELGDKGGSWPKTTVHEHSTQVGSWPKTNVHKPSTQVGSCSQCSYWVLEHSKQEEAEENWKPGLEHSEGGNETKHWELMVGQRKQENKHRVLVIVNEKPEVEHEKPKLQHYQQAKEHWELEIDNGAQETKLKVSNEQQEIDHEKLEREPWQQKHERWQYKLKHGTQQNKLNKPKSKRVQKIKCRLQARENAEQKNKNGKPTTKLWQQEDEHDKLEREHWQQELWHQQRKLEEQQNKHVKPKTERWPNLHQNIGNAFCNVDCMFSPHHSRGTASRTAFWNPQNTIASCGTQLRSSRGTTSWTAFWNPSNRAAFHGTQLSSSRGTASWTGFWNPQTGPRSAEPS